MELIVFFIVIVLLLIGIPLLISILIYRVLKKKAIDRRFRFLAIIPFLLLGYFLYDAFYPKDDFYKEDFKEVTQMTFPEDGEIVYKTASFPDQFGDYASSCLVQLDPNSCKQLKRNLIRNGFIAKENKMFSKELDYIENKIIDLKYAEQYIKDSDTSSFYSVGFLKDSELVIITRISW